MTSTHIAIFFLGVSQGIALLLLGEWLCRKAKLRNTPKEGYSETFNRIITPRSVEVNEEHDRQVVDEMKKEMRGDVRLNYKSDRHGTIVNTKPIKLFTAEGESNCHGSPSWQFLGGILRDCISAGTYERLQRQFDVLIFLDNEQYSIIPPSAWFPDREHTFFFPTEYNLKMRVETSRCTENLEPHVGDMRCGFGSIDIREVMRPEVEHLLEDIKSCIDIELEEWNSAWCVQRDTNGYLMIVGKWSFLIEGNRINSKVSFIRVL